MMNKYILSILLVLLIGNVYADNFLKLTVTPGEHYSHRAFGIKMIPQMAIWLENKKGETLKELYVSEFVYKKLRDNENDRPATLPVWIGKNGNKLPEYNTADQATLLDLSKNKQIEIDGITGATPKKEFIVKYKIPVELSGQEVVVRMEVNNSFDFNEKYKKGLSEDDPYFNGVNGQPSIIWEGTVTLSKGASVKLEPVGHGSPVGNDGRMKNSLVDITTAAGILKSVVVEFF